MSAQQVFPHERRVQRYAYAAFLAAAALGAVLLLRAEGRVLGIEVPFAASAFLLFAGLVAGLVAAQRRNATIAIVAIAVLVLAVAADGRLRPGILDYALGFAFGVALLAAGELVHMTVRYERAHRAVERDNVPEEHVNRVTDEALATLGVRAAVAVVAAFAVVALVQALARVGPAAWRDSLELTAPLGIAVTALALLGLASLYILFSGATLRGGADNDSTETVSDVAE